MSAQFEKLFPIRLEDHESLTPPLPYINKQNKQLHSSPYCLCNYYSGRNHVFLTNKRMTVEEEKSVTGRLENMITAFHQAWSTFHHLDHSSLYNILKYEYKYNHHGLNASFPAHTSMSRWSK